MPGSHEDAPDGFLLAYGAPMRSGRARLGSIVDVAPTVLYLLGLPVARDMDGVARTDLFKPAFTATAPDRLHPDLRAVTDGGRRGGFGGYQSKTIVLCADTRTR